MRAPLSLALVVLLGACAGRTGPKDVLSAYLEAEKLGRYDDAHALLTDADQSQRPLPRYIAEHLSAGPIWLAVAKRTTFKLGKPDGDDAAVSIPVTARHLDMAAVEASLSGVPTEQLERSDDPGAEMLAYVETELTRFEVQGPTLPTVDESLTYAVRNEDGAWRVWLGLALQDAAIQATAEARQATAQGKTGEAHAAWHRVMALDPDPGGVVAYLQKEAKTALEALGDEVPPPAE